MEISPWNNRVSETVNKMMEEVPDDDVAMWKDVKTALEAASNRVETPCILSDKQILAEMEKGEIAIIPFTRDNLGNCSYDITLGEWYYSQRDRDMLPAVLPAHLPITLNKMWQGPELASLITIDGNPEYAWVREDDKFIRLYPGQSILAHSQEVVGARSKHTTMMRARSTTSRLGLSICNDGGWGDVGFVNRWCMVIKNQGDVTLALKVGMKIAQIIFLHVGEVSKPYSGNYVQSHEDAQKTLDTWKPESMLPKR